MLLRALGGVLGLAAGLVTAVAVLLFLGPTTQVTCDSSTGPAAVAEEALQGLGSGHVDGPTRSTCPVPSTAGWVLGALSVPVGVAGGVWLLRPRDLAEPGPDTFRA